MTRDPILFPANSVQRSLGCTLLDEHEGPVMVLAVQILNLDVINDQFGHEVAYAASDGLLHLLMTDARRHQHASVERYGLGYGSKVHLLVIAGIADEPSRDASRLLERSATQLTPLPDGRPVPVSAVLLTAEDPSALRSYFLSWPAPPGASIDHWVLEALLPCEEGVVATNPPPDAYVLPDGGSTAPQQPQ